MDLNKESREIERIQSQLRFLRKSRKQARLELEQERSNRQNVLQAQSILQGIAQSVQQLAHQKIAEIVSSCLSSVFDEPYEFKIYFEQKRGKTEARFRFIRGTLDVDPITASGGGVVDVAAFALRVACLLLHRPRLRRVIVLDEPFKFVSSQYRENVREMLESLANNMGLQIIMVTHDEALETGTVIEI